MAVFSALSRMPSRDLLSALPLPRHNAYAGRQLAASDIEIVGRNRHRDRNSGRSRWVVLADRDPQAAAGKRHGAPRIEVGPQETRALGVVAGNERLSNHSLRRGVGYNRHNIRCSEARVGRIVRGYLESRIAALFLNRKIEKRYVGIEQVFAAGEFIDGPPLDIFET